MHGSEILKSISESLHTEQDPSLPDLSCNQERSSLRADGLPGLMTAVVACKIGRSAAHAYVLRLALPHLHTSAVQVAAALAAAVDWLSSMHPPVHLVMMTCIGAL